MADRPGALHDVGRAPDIGTGRSGLLGNLVPDHLDWHGGFEAYGAAEAQRWQTRRAGDWAVHNDDAAAVAPADASVPGGGGA